MIGRIIQTKGRLMKALMIFSLALSMVSALAADKPKSSQETYGLNTESTKIEWVGTKVTGEHRGLIKVKEGSSLTFKGDQITGGNVVIDLNSLTVTDLTDPEYVAKFVGHMKSADFFNTEKYPEAKLVITKSKKTKDGLELEGKLTILDKTQPIKFTATAPSKTTDSFTSKAVIKIDRTKFGLKYGSGQFFKDLGDKMIHDEFTLNIDLNAKKL
jgi:polyisoprenoid-binding protein YceI